VPGLGTADPRPSDADDPATSEDDAVPESQVVPPVSPSAVSIDLVAAGALTSPSQQVAAALSSLADAGATGSSAAAPRAAASDPAVPGEIRTTSDGGREAVIRLDPEHLGSVSIRLKMTGGRVDVSIMVSDAHTLDVLDRDRHVLTAAVSAAGLGGGGLALSHGGLDATPASAAARPSPDGGGAGNREASGERSSDRQASDRQASDRQASDRQASDREAASSGDRSGERRRDGRAPASSRDAALDDVGSSAARPRAGGLYV
jgi:hypothetical protein